MALQLHLPVLRPQHREDCARRRRPCPFVTCRYHLLLDVLEDGTIEVMNREVVTVYGRALKPHQEVPEGWSDLVVDALFRMPETCALDVADSEELRRDDDFANYADVGEFIGCGRERVRQICDAALERVKDGVVSMAGTGRDGREDLSPRDAE